jgi:hypothetical protein
MSANRLGTRGNQDGQARADSVAATGSECMASLNAYRVRSAADDRDVAAGPTR